MLLVRILTLLIGIPLIPIGAVGVILGIGAILDPEGTKMADDNDPNGTPPSRIGSAVFTLVSAGILVGGGLLVVWNPRRQGDHEGKTSSHTGKDQLPVTIRPATTDDLPAILGLTREIHAQHVEACPETFRNAPSDEEMAGAFRAQIEESPGNHACWLVAEAGAIAKPESPEGEETPQPQLAGYLNSDFRQSEASWCLAKQTYGYLCGIVVAPEFRRRGVATALVAALKREAGARGVPRVELDVWAFNEESAQAFARLGFQPLRQRMELRVEERE